MFEQTPKRHRLRLARSELIMFLSFKAGDWADDVGDVNNKTIPFEQWPADDPMRDLAARYGLSGADLSKMLRALEEELEARAERVGFEEAWR